METATVQDPGAVAAAMLRDLPEPDGGTVQVTAPESASVPESSPVAPKPEPAPESASLDARFPVDPSIPLDAHGHPYRPGFHRINPDGSPYKNDRGDYMPRGGRKPGIPNKPKPGAPSVPVLAPKPQPAPKLQTLADVGASPWSEAERSAALSAESDAQPEAVTASETPAQSAAVSVVDVAAEGAEVGCRVVYSVTGAIFGSFDDCEPEQREHVNMRKALTAYIRSKGWTATAGWGVILMFAAYMLRTIRKPAPKKAVAGWVAEWKASKAKTVQPIPPPQAQPEAKPETPSRSAYSSQTYGIVERSA